jgi:hypothetical protein
MVVSAKILLDEIAPDLVAYLKGGTTINLASFVAKALPELSSTDLDRLLKIHFLLTETADGEVGVVDFARDLPGRLQRIRTTVEPRTRRYDGEVHGRVQWNRTLLERSSRIGAGDLLFVCDEIERNYETAENQVLKAVIGIITGIVQQDLATVFLNGTPAWLSIWAPDSRLRQEFLNVSGRNVYLRRIEVDADRITDAMIARALRSRLPLYRDAAALLARYRWLRRHEIDEAEARRLLATTFIRPDRVAVLFELYWVILIIRAFRHTAETIGFRPIEPGAPYVAQWTIAGDIYTISHDSTGRFGFNESIATARETLGSPDTYFGRLLRVREEFQVLTGGTSDHLWGGRPDLVLEVTRADGRRSVLLGEVKYTRSRDYAAQGLRELLEYMALARDGDYLEPYDRILGPESQVRGCLFTDALETPLITGTGTVRHLMHNQPAELIDALIPWIVDPPAAGTLVHPDEEAGP